MREIKQERLIKDVRRVLENPFWIPDLNTEESYRAVHDDTDGTNTGSITISFSPDGDIWVNAEPNHNGGPLRFRTFFGGGKSPRVRNALMILALAIKLDNNQNPKFKIFS